MNKLPKIVYSSDAESDTPLTTELNITGMAWISAQYCVLNKLKSPIGKPQETLGHIDVACRKLASVPSQSLDMNQAKGLINLVHYLEKLMVNAWDGSVSDLPSANKSASLFFYANKKTCRVSTDYNNTFLSTHLIMSIL